MHRTPNEALDLFALAGLLVPAERLLAGLLMMSRFLAELRKYAVSYRGDRGVAHHRKNLLCLAF